MRKEQLSSWYDRVPENIAEAQYVWESYQMVWRVNQAGMPMADIANKFDVTVTKIRQVLHSCRTSTRSPVERYLSDETAHLRDIADLADVRLMPSHFPIPTRTMHDTPSLRRALRKVT